MLEGIRNTIRIDVSIRIECKHHTVSVPLGETLSANAGGRDPSSAPHIVVDRLGRALELGQDLDSAGPATDQGDALPRDIQIRRPVCRMHQSALELVQAGDLGPLPLVEDADGRYNHIGGVC